MAHRDMDEEELEGEVDRGTYSTGVTPEEKGVFEQLRRDRSSKDVRRRLAKRVTKILSASNGRAVKRLLRSAKGGTCGEVSEFELYFLTPFLPKKSRRYACMAKRVADALQETAPEVRDRFEAIGRQANMVVHGRKSKVQRRFARLAVAALLVANHTNKS